MAPHMKSARWWLSIVVLSGCWSGSQPSAPPAPATSRASTTAQPVVPSVEVIGQAEWEACADCDEQSLEGGAPLRFANLPAVTLEGDLIAVVEERDGWGHVPVPGVRILGRDGMTITWLPIAGTGAQAATAAGAVNRELARHTWTRIMRPAPTTRALPADGLETEVTFGPYTAHYRQRHDGDTLLPPAEIRVVDGAGHVIAERRDTEHAWSAPPTCNLPAFQLVGVSATARVMLFTTGLGMGGHNCDGVEQRPSWHVLALR